MIYRHDDEGLEARAAELRAKLAAVHERIGAARERRAETIRRAPQGPPAPLSCAVVIVGLLVVGPLLLASLRNLH